MISLLCKQTRARPLKRAGDGPLENKTPPACSVFVAFVSSLLVVGLIVQFSEANFVAQEGKPCICNSTFYRQCPSQSNCMEDVVMDPEPPSPKSIKDSIVSSAIHDDTDPDHIDIIPTFGSPIKIKSILNKKPNANSNSNANSNLNSNSDSEADSDSDSDSNLNLNSDLNVDSPLDWRSSSTGTGAEPNIIRHRKVYLARRPKNWTPQVHKFTIRIPVVPPPAESVDIPEPKPIYKMRRYTSYETKPELQMVPVTKTIIKPVGVSPDQIIDENNIGTKRKVKS